MSDDLVTEMSTEKPYGRVMKRLQKTKMSPVIANENHMRFVF